MEDSRTGNLESPPLKIASQVDKGCFYLFRIVVWQCHTSHGGVTPALGWRLRHNQLYLFSPMKEVEMTLESSGADLQSSFKINQQLRWHCYLLDSCREPVFFQVSLLSKAAVQKCFSHAGSIRQKNGIVKLLNTHEVVPCCPQPVPKQISEPYVISPWL